MPMFGPGLLFVLWCAIQWVVSPKAYPLKSALDPMGWLYVGAGMAIPCAVDSYSRKIITPMSIGVGAGALICVLLVLAGMAEKAKTTSWEPRKLMHVVAAVVAIGLVIVSYNVHADVVAYDENARAVAAGRANEQR